MKNSHDMEGKLSAKNSLATTRSSSPE